MDAEREREGERAGQARGEAAHAHAERKGLDKELRALAAAQVRTWISLFRLFRPDCHYNRHFTNFVYIVIHHAMHEECVMAHIRPSLPSREES